MQLQPKENQKKLEQFERQEYSLHFSMFEMMFCGARMMGGEEWRSS